MLITLSDLYQLQKGKSCSCAKLSIRSAACVNRDGIQLCRNAPTIQWPSRGPESQTERADLCCEFLGSELSQMTHGVYMNPAKGTRGQCTWEVLVLARASLAEAGVHHHLLTAQNRSQQ